MSTLNQKRCVACEGMAAPLALEKIKALLSELHNAWSVTTDHCAIERLLTFKNFYETMAFVNAIAWIAHTENHHPDLKIGYNSCHIRYTTHALHGLSQNDFICASKIDQCVS